MLDPAAKLMRGLTEALVLESLGREPKHGYALLKELEGVFGEPPNRNRIYPLLSRLEEEGYVEGLEEPDSSRGKTTYSLTEAGAERLEAYQRMPDGFRETLDRFWGAGGPAAGGGPADEGDGDEDDEPAADGEAGGPTSAAGDEAGAEAEVGGDGEGGGTGGHGGDDPGPPGDGDGSGGMDLRRNPETGEVEMVIRGTHWGEVRIELGDIRGGDGGDGD